MQGLVDLSRVVSHALRHEPWVYELELDAEGWVPVESLIFALRAAVPECSSLTADDLSRMISEADKKRHELVGGRIRALYGHSTPFRLLKVKAEPPAFLYHGTTPFAVATIRQQGLRPMSRQYVHLSADIATAQQVGRRKTKAPELLQIKAAAASASGVPFYRGNEKVWLADAIPSAFIGSILATGQGTWDAEPSK